MYFNFFCEENTFLMRSIQSEKTTPATYEQTPFATKSRLTEKNTTNPSNIQTKEQILKNVFCRHVALLMDTMGETQLAEENREVVQGCHKFNVTS